MGIAGLHAQGNFIVQMTTSPPVIMSTLFLRGRQQKGERHDEENE